MSAAFPAATTPARVLLAEDEAPMRRGVAILLQAKGYEVLEAASGTEALVKAHAAKPDLLVLDVMMPGKTGFEVLQALRAAGAATPVIMLTAKGTEADKVLGFTLGVDDYVTKPFSTLELLGRIEAVLRQSGAPLTAADIHLERGFYESALLHSREIRNRFTVLDIMAADGRLSSALPTI